MRILLVDPPLSYLTDHSIYKDGPPISFGLLSIEAYLHQHGHTDTRIQNFYRCTEEEVETALGQYAPDLVALSCASDTRGFCWNLARTAKKINSEVRVVLGNVHATFFPRELMERYPVDFCVLHEGELTMLELVEALEQGSTDFGTIPGLAWRHPGNGEIQLNQVRPLIKDLDSLPIPPNLRIFTDENGRKKANMFSSRGCPFGCAFCSGSAFWQRSWRKHSPERTVKEFMMLVDQGAEVIDIYDDLFTMDFDRAHRICDQLIDKGNTVPWFARARVDRIEEELVDKMVTAGCCEISFGIESGDPETLKRINKRIDLDQAIAVFHMLRKKKLVARANFMIGNPGESAATVNASIDLACRLNADAVNASMAMVYPCTLLDREAQMHGLIKPEFWYADDAPVPYYTVDMSLRQLQALATKMVLRWSLNRGPVFLLRTFIRNWHNVGARRSLRFIGNWLFGLFGKR